MPVIRMSDALTTQINVFTVEPGRDQQLIEHLARAARVAREVPGWVSASLHRSLDGTRVVNYAQSENLAAAEAVIEHLTEQGFIRGNRAFGQANPGLYEVVFTLDRAAL
ncbi:antibiotic biosynthesis monooxygenase [Nocardia sp. NEAU-G5]|uniref:Antibiotic biosynthesis monooxygenase n=1 Tax=Nocardia albiluteola TaxID=2842303 RepID=A0ABS6B3Y6_9NOCA|nr:antibiotic biosynthesis monooxygenase family protein [Nocardia albiluteola]MBU3065012.1 antibiotic biosynthesis monooxygenase [Nocardia albiluteola]